MPLLASASEYCGVLHLKRFREQARSILNTEWLQDAHAACSFVHPESEIGKIDVNGSLQLNLRSL